MGSIGKYYWMRHLIAVKLSWNYSFDILKMLLVFYFQTTFFLKYLFWLQHNIALRTLRVSWSPQIEMFFITTALVKAKQTEINHQNFSRQPRICDRQTTRKSLNILHPGRKLKGWFCVLSVWLIILFRKPNFGPSVSGKQVCFRRNPVSGKGLSVSRQIGLGEPKSALLCVWDRSRSLDL